MFGWKPSLWCLTPTIRTICSANKLCIKQITAYKIWENVWLTKAPFISLNTTPLNTRGVSGSAAFSFSSLQPSCLKNEDKKKNQTDVDFFNSEWLVKRPDVSLSLLSDKAATQNHSRTWSPALVNKERKLHPDRLTEDSGSPSRFGLRMDTWCSHWLFKHIKKKLISHFRSKQTSFKKSFFLPLK